MDGRRTNGALNKHSRGEHLGPVNSSVISTLPIPRVCDKSSVIGDGGGGGGGGRRLT